MVPSIRQPAVAGKFYPLAEAELRVTVHDLLAQARIDPSTARRPKAIIVPHAGYAFSGASAARAFALLVPFAHTIERTVVLGPAHGAYVQGVVWPGTDKVKTPLGEIDVDRVRLSLAPRIAADARAHSREHSVEVELPFLQVIAPRAKVIPLAVGRTSPEEVADVLGSLWGGPGTVIVVSSDLSQDLSYEEGRALDEATASRIVALDATLEGGEACGAAGVNALLTLARKKGLHGELVDLRSSGDTELALREEVVGYGAFAFYEP